MQNQYTDHIPNCKIPPCSGGCQNVVCHEHVECCMFKDSDQSILCAPQCRRSASLTDVLRREYDYNETERWPTDWGKKFATLRKMWSDHSKFSNCSLQAREDLSDENMTAVNIKCGALTCTPESYLIRQAAVSKFNRCSCAAKNKARKKPVESYYDESQPETSQQYYTRSSRARNCSKDCPNRNNPSITFQDDVDYEYSRQSQRNPYATTPNRYSGRESYNERHPSTRRDYMSNVDEEIPVRDSANDISEHEGARGTNTYNSGRRGRSEGGECRGSNHAVHKKEYKNGHEHDHHKQQYMSRNNSQLRDAHHISHKTNARQGQSSNKHKQRPYESDDELTNVVSQDLSIVFNKNCSNNSKRRSSSINISYRQPKHNQGNVTVSKGYSSRDYLQKVRK